MEKTWWKESVVYQVYPRSFKDSNNDGVGDLPGLLSKLDYLASLGIDLIWLNPVYVSPNYDNGYDISDYQQIMREFGTMADFDALLEGLHARGIKLLMDLVVNHTSDEHAWFKEARKSRDNPYRDYYIWWDAGKGKPPHRSGFFDPNGEAWTYEVATDSYYLHYFSSKQPDLNWDNPKLRQEVYASMRFWFDKGVDGLRMDAISYISKDKEFPEVTPEMLNKRFPNDWSYYYARGPHLHEYLKEINQEVLSHYDIVTIAELPGIPREEALSFVHPGSKELHMLYHFEGMGLGLLPGVFKRPDPEGIDLKKFKYVYSEWDKVFADEGWGTIYLGNHDQPRMVTRWGNDAPEYREASAKMLITFLLSMRATPIFYNGDELGMTNIKFERIDDYRDVETLSMHRYFKAKGEDVGQFLKDQQIMARDNSRTPFQWDATPNAGFTTGTPWMMVNPNHTFINMEAQDADGFSVLNYFRQMVRLRKEHGTLVYGKYLLHDPEHSEVYCYSRRDKQGSLLVVLNFSTELVRYDIPEGIRIEEEPLINNATSVLIEDRQIVMLPYQGLIFKER